MTTPGGRDWDEELAKVERQMASLSDAQLLRQSQAGKGGPVAPEASGAAAIGQSARPSRAGAYLRVGLALAVAIGVTIWPYGTRCGAPLLWYMGAVLVAVGAGVWAALSTWRARAGRSHVMGLVVIGWCLALAAAEVLPRVGYAPDPSRVGWLCR